MKFPLLSTQQRHPSNLGFHWRKETGLPKHIESPASALLAQAPREEGGDGA